MRYLHRTHRVSVARLHEAYVREDFHLLYEKTDRMCADIYTKAFTDTSKWDAACGLINIVDPKVLQRYLQKRHETLRSEQNETEAGGQNGAGLPSGKPPNPGVGFRSGWGTTNLTGGGGTALDFESQPLETQSLVASPAFK